tara:strand:- start:189 stop:491 length:303 start_codon:yes stop_codon:yes gene_type:complete
MRLASLGAELNEYKAKLKTTQTTLSNETKEKALLLGVNGDIGARVVRAEENEEAMLQEAKISRTSEGVNRLNALFCCKLVLGLIWGEDRDTGSTHKLLNR